MHFEGNEQINALVMTLWPEMSLTELKGEVRATVSPLKVDKIVVRWAEETRDPTQITYYNCVEVTRELKARCGTGDKEGCKPGGKERCEPGDKEGCEPGDEESCEPDSEDELFIYYFKAGDAQSGEDREDTAAEAEAICPNCHSIVTYQME